MRTEAPVTSTHNIDMSARKSNPSIDKTEKPHDFVTAMLDWYAQHKRPIPWRSPQEQHPNPYHVWLSEIMCQQTTVGAVVPYFLKFIALWPDIFALAKADRDQIMQEWAGLGYYARARNLHQCAQTIVKDYNGVFPSTQSELKTLPGIGEYTSAAIAAIAFNRPATVVDGNIERVMTRFCAITDPLPQSKPAIKRHASVYFSAADDRCGDFAQSLMDLGAAICIPKTPKCTMCPVHYGCKARKMGVEASLPAKKKKAANPQKFGYVYWIKKDDQVLLQQRPDTEMLGGMHGFPCTDWVHKSDKENIVTPENIIINEDLDVSIFHSFTHFDLELHLMRASIEKPLKPDMKWVSIQDFKPDTLPTLFKKVWSLGITH